MTWWQWAIIGMVALVFIIAGVGSMMEMRAKLDERLERMDRLFYDPAAINKPSIEDLGGVMLMVARFDQAYVIAANRTNLLDGAVVDDWVHYTGWRVRPLPTERIDGQVRIDFSGYMATVLAVETSLIHPQQWSRDTVVNGTYTIPEQGDHPHAS